MEFGHANFSGILQNFQRGLSKEELEVFGCTTLRDVRTTITSIQARQEAERTMMDMTRLEAFIKRMEEMTPILRAFDEATDYMAFVWGPFKAMLYSTSQDQKALDILLDAYDRLGSSILVLQGSQSIFTSHPRLYKILELIYQDVLQFQESALRWSTHPSMRTLFRSMWNDYKGQFDAKLDGLEELTRRLTKLEDTSTLPASQGTTVVNFFAGSYYGTTEVHGDGVVHQGDVVNDADVSKVLHRIGDLEKSLEETKLLLETREKRSHDERIVRIREWIAGSVPYRRQEQIYKIHCEYPETGLWILNNDLVAAWMKDDLPRNPVIWIHGIPGAGKSVLASVIIDACARIDKSHTAYFYYDDGDRDTRITMPILKCLLMQAVEWRPELMSYFNDQRRTGGEPTIYREETLKRLANLIFHGGDRVYLVIDGVDECSPNDRKSTLLFLDTLVKQTDEKDPGKLRLMVISQNEPEIRKALPNARELEIDKSMNRNDIGLYVEDYAEKIGSKFELNQDEVWALGDRTCRYAAGQFLYATLVMKDLFGLSTRSQLRKEMEESRFPKKLSEAYERIMKRIRENVSDEDWKTTQKLLGWMTCAARPLKWHEMQGASSIVFVDSKVDFEEEALRTHVHDLCGALVSVDHDRISLVHSTARKFIAQSSYINHALVDCQLANLCIRYLTLRAFDVDLGKEALREFVLEGYFAFVDYAAAKWMHHLYRVADQAQALADPRNWFDCEIDVEELMETIQEFSQKFHQEFQSSQDQAKFRKTDTQLSPAVISLIGRCSIEDAKPSFQKLWTHAQIFRTGDLRARNVITPQELQTAIEQIREVLEEVFSDKRLGKVERQKLERYYGEKIYRCPKTSCYFFHQGFTDRASRKKHIARHERLYDCLEPDCPSAEFGFVDKKALSAHVLEAHPDSELKASLFEKPVTKQSEFKFPCDKCGKSFTRKSILQEHQIAEAGQKPHECSKCGKGFARKSDCRRHETSHDNRMG